MGRSIYATTITPWSKLRIDHGLTLKDVGELTGIRPSELSKIFNGKTMCKPEYKEKLMDVFDLGYSQVNDICNRTYTFHFNGDLRGRSGVEFNSSDNKETVEIAAIENPEDNSECTVATSPITVATAPTPVSDLGSNCSTENIENQDNNTEIIDSTEIIDKILDTVYGNVTRTEYTSIVEFLENANKALCHSTT